MKIPLAKSLLRPVKITDAASLALHANNMRVAENLRDVFPHPYTLKDARTFIINIASDTRNLIMALEINGEAAGVIGIHPQTDIYRKSAELGYWLGEKYWGRGIITEAVNALVNYAFEHIDINRIYANVFEKNIASMKVLEKCGFICEAVQKKAVVKNNIIMDEHVYARLLI
jgi:[ribosomal protein S5]-alanine N-acetyltransferase